MKTSFLTQQPRIALCALLTLAGLHGTAQAGDSPWSVRVGPAQVSFDATATVSVAGSTVPGGNVAVEDNTTLALDFGYALGDRWTIRTAIGVPPTTKLSVAGSLKNLVPPLTGTLGKVQYGPAVVSLTWKLGDFGSFQPYVGAGINYTHIFSTQDGDLSGLKVQSAWGTALQAGFDIPIDKNWGLFFDARKLFVKTKATGSITALGGPPAEATVTLDPLIVHMGASYRF